MKFLRLLYIDIVVFEQDGRRKGRGEGAAAAAAVAVAVAE
jgi:hypothetical protein